MLYVELNNFLLYTSYMSSIEIIRSMLLMSDGTRRWWWTPGPRKRYRQNHAAAASVQVKNRCPAQQQLVILRFLLLYSIENRICYTLNNIVYNIAIYYRPIHVSRFILFNKFGVGYWWRVSIDGLGHGEIIHLKWEHFFSSKF